MESSSAGLAMRWVAWTAAVVPVLVGLGLVAGRVWLGWGEIHPPRIRPGSLAGRAELGGFADVRIRAADGIELGAWWRPGPNRGAVLLVHGWGANREQLLPLALPLARAGWGVLLVDLRGHGDSQGASRAGDAERLDVAAAVRFLESRPDVDWIGAAGFSLGADALAAEAPDLPALRAIVLDGAYTTLEEALRTEYGPLGVLPLQTTRAVLRLAGVRLAGVSPLERLPAFAPRPVLLAFGEQDALLPPGTPRRMLAAAGPSAELWVLRGAGHVPAHAARPEEAPGRVLNFLERARAAEARRG
jgi:pimeloyl-ACP methyl ester carboxylesterase